MTYDFTTLPESLDEFWMPFTPQRLYRQSPRFFISAEGMYLKDGRGRDILDAAAAMWCTNVGHRHPRVVEAMRAQLDTLDYATCFQFGHPAAFRAATRIANALPAPFNRVFFSNSGSESVESALKIALSYHKARGEPGRQVLIGRERAYHGVDFGGISVGGLTYNRKPFGPLLPRVDHLPHTFDLEHNAYSRGLPAWGAHLADALENLILFHDPASVAAVIVEPVPGSTGVLPPPQGYLKRLREICDKYGVLLIFDEVITGFGRLGEISAAQAFGVEPDILCFAKGLTNGAVPMGATVVRESVWQAFQQGPDNAADLYHGYTYSGHPLGAAAILGVMDALEQDHILENARAMAAPFEDAIHSLKGRKRVVDIRNIGLMGAVELEPGPAEDPSKWQRAAMLAMFERGILARYTGNVIAVSPPLIVSKEQIDRIFTELGEVLDAL